MTKQQKKAIEMLDAALDEIVKQGLVILMCDGSAQVHYKRDYDKANIFVSTTMEKSNHNFYDAGASGLVLNNKQVESLYSNWEAIKH